MFERLLEFLRRPGVVVTVVGGAIVARLVCFSQFGLGIAGQALENWWWYTQEYNKKPRSIMSGGGIVKNTEMEVGDKIDLSKQDQIELDPVLAKGEYPAFTDDHTSLMRKHLTKEVWQKMKGKKAPCGFTIEHCINTGVKNARSIVGCHAGDLESYSIFADLFDPVIDSYHGGYKPDAVHPTDMNPSGLKGEIEDKSNIISTRIRIARNLEGFSLAPGMNDVSEKENIEKLMIEVFKTLPDDLAGTYHPLHGMPEETRQELIRDHFLFKGNDKMQADSGYHKFWPRGRGIFINKAKTFLLWINEGDHLRIISMEQGGDVNSVFSRLARGANAIEAGIKKLTGKSYMITPHLGAVTCCPSNLGTGLRGSVLIKVPKLAAKGEKHLHDICEKFGLQARGLYGEHSTTVGGIHDISNKYRLGYSEVQLVQMMLDGVNEVNKLEKAA